MRPRSLRPLLQKRETMRKGDYEARNCADLETFTHSARRTAWLASLTPASTPVMTTLTVATGAAASLIDPAPRSGGGKLPFALAGGLLSVALLRNRRRLRSRLLTCIAICALGVSILGIGSCGSGSSSSSGGGGSTASTGTAAGTSTVTITATGGSITKTATYTLTV
jgi:hypothetical protein